MQPPQAVTEQGYHTLVDRYVDTMPTERDREADAAAGHRLRRPQDSGAK